MAIGNIIALPQLSTKRKIDTTTLFIKGQKYKAIFGMIFLIDNAIDFINSKQEIHW